MKFGESIILSDAAENDVKIEKTIAKIIFGELLNNKFTFLRNFMIRRR